MTQEEKASFSDSLSNENITVSLEQYKLLVNSLNSLNNSRETSNNFWITVHGLGISGLAYIRDTNMFPNDHKPVAILMIIFLGIMLCAVWYSYLSAVKYSVELRNKLLVAIEERFSIKIYTYIFESIGRSKGKGSLTSKEMFVPALFMILYIAAGVLLFFPTFLNLIF